MIKVRLRGGELAFVIIGYIIGIVLSIYMSVIFYTAFYSGSWETIIRLYTPRWWWRYLPVTYEEVWLKFYLFTGAFIVMLIGITLFAVKALALKQYERAYWGVRSIVGRGGFKDRLREALRAVIKRGGAFRLRYWEVTWIMTGYFMTFSLGITLGITFYTAFFSNALAVRVNINMYYEAIPEYFLIIGTIIVIFWGMTVLLMKLLALERYEKLCKDVVDFREGFYEFIGKDDLKKNIRKKIKKSIKK